MATAYGSTVQHWRCKIVADITSETDTAATVRCRTYWCSISWGYNVNGCTGYAQVGSYSSGSKTFHASSSTGQSKEILVATQTHTYSKGSSAQTITCKGQVKQVDYHAGTSTASVNVTISKINYSAPNPPTSIQTTRNSDSKITCTWTNGATSTTKPRSNVLVERRTDAGDFTQIAKLSASATSYADTSVSANHRYSYRFRSYGAGGYSAYSSASSYLYMTPAAPSKVTISRAGDGTAVQVAATVTNVNYATAYNVQYQVDGGEWTSAGSTVSFPYTFTPNEGGSTQVRVQWFAPVWRAPGRLVTLSPRSCLR